MMFVWLIILGVLLYYLFGGEIKHDIFHQKNPNILLDERLAKGEISIEEYLEIKSTLEEKE